MKQRFIKIISILSIISILALQFSALTVVSATDEVDTTAETETVSKWLTAEEAGVLAPEEYAYSMAVVGDTQCMNWQDGVKGTKYMYNLYTYLADNSEEMKLQYVMGLGDITDNNNTAEWKYAAESVKQLDGKVGYSLIEGNHDNRDLNGGKGVIDGMNTYFGMDSTYANQYFSYYDNSARNTAHAFKTGNQKWLVFALETVPSSGVRSWATSLMQEMSDYNVIITTHQWLNGDGSYFQSGDTNPNTVTQTLYNGLVANNSNVKMVFCGHVTPKNGSIVGATTTNAAGDTVYEFVIDPQGMDYSNSNGLGYTPYGMVAFYYFDENGDVIDLQYYSTVKDMYMNLDADGVARQYEINAISSEVDDIPEVIGQDTSLTIADRPYSFTAYSGDTLPSWKNGGISAKLVDGISPDGSALAITEIPRSSTQTDYAAYQLKFDKQPASTEGLEGICFWLKTGTRKRSVYFSTYSLNSNYVIKFVAKDGTIATYAGDTNGTRLMIPTNFEGWVYLSFDNFSKVMDPTSLGNLQINTDQGSSSTSATYYIDSIGYYYGSSDEELTYLMDSEVENTAVTATNATVSVTSGISDQGKELRVKMAKSVASSNFSVTATNSEYTLPQNGYLSFWVKNNGYANYYKFSAVSGENTYTASNTASKVLLLNDNTSVSSATIVENGITIPAYFEGWVLVPYSAFDVSPAGAVIDNFAFAVTLSNSSNISWFVIDSIAYADNIDDLSSIVGFENSFVPLLDAEGRANEIIDYTYTGNATVTLENEVSPYGRAIKVVTPTEKGKYPQIYAFGNGAKAYNSQEVEGFAFWVKSVDSKYEATLGLYVNRKELFVAGGTYYRVPDGSAASKQTISSVKKIEIPSGFEGWIVVPKESCSFTVTQIDLINIAAWDPAYQLGCTFYFDSFGYYTNERLMVDARAMENFTVVSQNTVNWQSSGSYFSYSYVDNVSPDKDNALKITANKDASWKQMELKADNSVLKTVDGYNGFAMWIKNEDTVNSATVYVYQRNSLVNLGQISGTYYLISSNGTITTKTGTNPSIPAGFEGWFVLPKTKFSKNGLWDSSVITTFYFDFVLKSGQTLYIDSLGYYRDFEQFKADTTKTGLGDVNADYSINSEDLVLLRKHLLSSTEQATAKCPDVNLDTYVDVLDLVALKKVIAKIS